VSIESVEFEGRSERGRRLGHDRRDASADLGICAHGVDEEPSRAADEGVESACSLALEGELESPACAERELVRRVAAYVPRSGRAEEMQDEGEAVLLVAHELFGPGQRVVVQGDGGLVLGRELPEPGLDGGSRLHAGGVGLVVGVFVEPVDLVGSDGRDLGRVEELGPLRGQIEGE